MDPLNERGVWHGLPANFWKNFQKLLNKTWSGKQAAFFEGGCISEKTVRRAAKEKRITEESLKKLARKLGFNDDWQSLLIALGGNLPPRPTAEAFGEIQPKLHQRLPRQKCPHPYPDGNNSPLPFQRKLGGDIYYAPGWIVRLQTNARYRVTCDFNSVWPEIEIVLYERVLHTEEWTRRESFGAVTSRNRASDVRPQVAEWLITCWGKKVMADVAPWFDFVPETFDLDTTAGLLKLHFSAPNRQGGEGGLPVSKSAAESSPTVHMLVVE